MDTAALAGWSHNEVNPEPCVRGACANKWSVVLCLLASVLLVPQVGPVSALRRPWAATWQAQPSHMT